MLFTPRPKGLGRDNFLKLNDGEEVSGIFYGGVYTFKQHWVNSRSVKCAGNGCNVCVADPDNFASFRFRMNFMMQKNGQWVPKIYEGGGKVYDALVNLDKKFDLSKTLIDICRRGVKQNTAYDILPRMDIALSGEDKEKLKAVPLLRLEENEEAA